MAETRLTNTIFNEVPPFASYVCSLALAANTAESVTAPSTGEFAGKPLVCSISATADVWVDDRATAIVGVDDNTGAAATLNPPVRRCAPGATISIISDATCIVSVEFWAFGG